MRILTESDLKSQAPSIFNEVAHSKLTDNYKVIPTIETVRGLANAGFYPVKVMETRARDKNNAPFAKHLIRFRQDLNCEVGGNVPEIVMVNSHNGLSSYQLRAGIYRLVCANGLVVGDDLFARFVRHQGDIVSKVVSSAQEIIEIMPKALELSQKWESIPLSIEAQIAYAQSASLLKWDEEDCKIEPRSLITPRRSADMGGNLWTTFNMVQERIINGGVRFYNKEANRRGKTRAVNSVSENSRLNVALWNLTEKMAEIIS
jgi:hypothetical protein